MKLGRLYANDDAGGKIPLASLYTFSGEKEKAYEILRMIASHSVFQFRYIMSLKQYNPFYESIRNEPEFQRILKDVELNTRQSIKG
jgi:hypothetical protein